MSVRLKVKRPSHDLPKGMTVMESRMFNERIGKRVKASAGRKKPRNPKEREMLLKWEKERGGKKWVKYNSN